jgi:hypothetical protein
MSRHKSSTPSRLHELQTDLSHWHSVNVGVGGFEDCGKAIMYAFALNAIQVHVTQDSLLVSEIEQNSMQDADSSVGMGEDASNVAMGSVTYENETGMTERLEASIDTLTSSINHGNGSGSVESMDSISSTVVPSIDATNGRIRNNAENAMSIDADSNEGGNHTSPRSTTTC